MNTPLIAVLDALSPWQATLVILVATLAGAFLVEVVGVRAARRLVTKTNSRIDDIVFEEIRAPIVITVFLAGVYGLSQSSALATAAFDAELLDRFFGKPSLTIIILVWGWALNQTVNRSVDDLQTAGRHYDFAPVFSNVWTLAVLVTAAFLILSLWNINITPLIGAAGIAGIAIGFAAKDTVANFFGGLALNFDDTYKIGDFVVLESGEAGTVVKVGVRSTTLMTRSEVLVTVPNAMLNAGKVINQSAPQRRIRIKIPIGVAYGTDIDTFETLVLEVAGNEDILLETPEPRLRFRQFGASALEYELLCWIASPQREGKARHQLNQSLYKALTTAGIEIPYPVRDLRFRHGSDANGNDRNQREPPEHPVSNETDR